jgi:hypothetical protein
MRLDRVTSKRPPNRMVLEYTKFSTQLYTPSEPGSEGVDLYPCLDLYRSICFPSRGQYLLVGTGTTVPAGIEKYFQSYKQSTNLAYQRERPTRIMNLVKAS